MKKGNSNKYTLLNKNEESGDIEMTDMSRKPHVQPQLPQPQPQSQQRPQPQSQQRPQPQSQQRPQPQYIQQPKYIKYQTIRQSANPRPTTINMNGTSFRMQGAPQPRKATIPQMEVACEHCTIKQLVPGNTQVYACCCCNEMNECYPLYGLFVCGSCQRKVCYPYGTSEMIRCTCCGTVNKVPTEPQKRYKTNTNNAKPQKMRQQEKPKVVQAEKKRFQKQEEYIDFFQSEQKPNNPKDNNSTKQEYLDEEEIEFEDEMPSLKESKEDGDVEYPLI